MNKIKSLFRRGPGPSGSKNSVAAAPTGYLPASVQQQQQLQQQQQIKTAASVSSLDNVGLRPKKPSKSHGSRDKLNDRTIDKEKGSTERLDAKDKLDKQKYKELKQMPVIQQQQHHAANNNLLNQRDIVNYTIEQGLSRDLTEINFDGPREVSFFLFIINIAHNMFFVCLFL